MRLRRSPLAGPRRRARERAAPGPLRDALAVPLPDADAPTDRLPLLAVDIETTGLHADSDRVLSVGWVPVDGRDIVLAGARYRVVRPERDEPVGPSATCRCDACSPADPTPPETHPRPSAQEARGGVPGSTTWGMLRPSRRWASTSPTSTLAPAPRRMTGTPGHRGFLTQRALIPAEDHGERGKERSVSACGGSVAGARTGG